MTSNSEINDSTVFVDTSQASSPAPSARLTCVDEAGDEKLKGFEITLTQGEKVLGRSPDNAVCIPHKRLSRHHARLIPEGDSWVIEDLNSTNGVFVNDMRERRVVLNDGDMIKLGPIVFRFDLLQPQPASASPVAPETASSLGAEGTMYAGHAEVLASLAAAQSDSPEARTERPPSSTGVDEKKSGGAGKFLLRYGLIFVLILALVGAGFYYLHYQRQQELNSLIKDYNLELRTFVEKYEETSVGSSPTAQEQALEEIRDLMAYVNVAAKKYPSSLALKELQAKLIFLEFERDFNKILRTGDPYEARELINETQEEASTLLSGEAGNENAITEVLELLELADIVVEFKEFRQRFSDPSLTSDGPTPNKFDLNKMENLETQFIEKKKANIEPLSFRYAEFKNTLERLEAQDMNMVDRWKAILNLKQNN